VYTPLASLLRVHGIHYTLFLSTADSVGASRVTRTTTPIDFASLVDGTFPRTMSDADTLACMGTFGYPNGTELSVGPPLFGYLAALEQVVSGYVLVIGPTTIHALQPRPVTVGDRVVHVIQIADDQLEPRQDMRRQWFHLPVFEELYQRWLHPYHRGCLSLGALQHAHTDETRSYTIRQSTSPLPTGGFTFRVIQPQPQDRHTPHTSRHDSMEIIVPKVRMQPREELEARGEWVFPPYPMFLSDIFNARRDRHILHAAQLHSHAIWYEGDRHQCGSDFRVICTPYLCKADGVADVFIPQLLTTAQQQSDIYTYAKSQGRTLPDAPRVYLGRELTPQEAKLVFEAGFLTTKHKGRGNSKFHRAIWPRCSNPDRAQCMAFKRAWDRQTGNSKPVNRTLF
jgi:hypothetical protein